MNQQATASHQQSRITGAIWLMAAQASVLLFGFATHFWIARALGQAPYGIFGVVLSFQSIFGLALTQGVPIAISRFVARDESHARSILKQGIRLQLIIGAVITIIMLLASQVFARLLGDQGLIPLLSFVAFVVLAQTLYPVYANFFSGMHRFNRQAFLTFAYAVIKLIGALSLIYAFNVYGAFAGFAIGGIAAGIIGWFWTRRLGGTKKKAFPTKALLSFAGTYVLILIGLQILISLDLFMVKALLQDDAQAGVYNVAVTLSKIPYVLLQALVFVLLPSVSKLTRPGESHDEAATFISDTIRYLIMLIVPGVALAAATSKPLIILFYSSTYIPAAPALTILMVGLGALAFYLLLASIVSGAGRARVGLYLTSVLLVISAVAGWFLIPRFGLVGAALQTTLASLIGLTLLAAYTFRTFRIPLPIRSTINILIASAIAVLPTYLWKATSLTLIPQYLLVGAIYLAVLILLREVRDSDRRRLASIHPALKLLASKI